MFSISVVSVLCVCGFFGMYMDKLLPRACFSDLAARAMAASLLAARIGKHCVPSHPMKSTTSSTKQKGLWDSGPWNLCRLTQVRLIFIFSSAHQGSCFWRGWQLMWLMEPLLIGFVSPLCSRFRRSQCLPWIKSPMMPNRAEGICCQPPRHKVWAKKTKKKN